MQFYLLHEKYCTEHLKKGHKQTMEQSLGTVDQCEKNPYVGSKVASPNFFHQNVFLCEYMQVYNKDYFSCFRKQTVFRSHKLLRFWQIHVHRFSTSVQGRFSNVTTDDEELDREVCRQEEPVQGQVLRQLSQHGSIRCALLRSRQVKKCFC